MYLGSKATCPSCRQQDATLQVSLLVNQVHGQLTVQQVEALTMAVQRGEARKWSREPKSGSWKNLAKQLAPPAKPELGSLAKVVSGFIRWPYAPWILALVFLSTFYTFYQYGLELANFYIPAICLVWTVLLILGIGTLVYIRNVSQAVSARVFVWSEQMAKWNQLFYCGRDEQIFAPANPRHVSPNQLKELLQ